MEKRSMRQVLLVVVLSLTPFLAHAQTSPPVPAADPTVHRHLGFFLRLDGGLGYMGSSTSMGGVNASMAGVAIPFGIAIGGAVAENFILAGDLWGTVAVAPSFTLGGQTTSASKSSFSLGGFGLNLTYYFMPGNIYISVTPSIVALSIKSSDTTSNSQAGFGTKFGLGKEWWVGDHWGLGLAAQFFLGINQDTGTNPPTWTTLGGGPAFSATYN
jgi:hypothetical protein